MRYKSDEVIMKEIREQLDKWVYCLGIGWWDLDVYYLDGKDAKKNFSSKDGNIILALTYADWRYGIASIYFNLPEVKKISSAELENTIVHELCHILVNEMREAELNHEERVVTGLTKAFLWTAAGVKRDE